MNRYEEFLTLLQSCEKDFTKFYRKGNKEAGVRLRKQMQAMRSLAKTVRAEIQDRNRASERADKEAASPNEKRL